MRPYQLNKNSLIGDEKMSELYYAILSSQNGNEDELLLLCEKFSPLLKKYSYKLYYDDAYYDLLVKFIEIIYKLPIKTGLFAKGDAYILSYLKKSVYNAYISLNRTKEKTTYYECTSDEYEYLSDKWFDSEDEYRNLIFMIDLHNVLTQKEFRLFILKFIYCLSESEIAKSEHITRQAINKRIKTIKSKLKDKFYNS